MNQVQKFLTVSLFVLSGLSLAGTGDPSQAQGPHGSGDKPRTVAQYNNLDLAAVYGKEARDIYKRSKVTSPVYFTLYAPQTYEDVLPVGKVGITGKVKPVSDKPCTIASGATLKFIGYSTDGRTALIQVYGKGIHPFTNTCKDGRLVYVAANSLPRSVFDDFMRNNAVKADYAERSFFGRVKGAWGWETGGALRALPFQSYGSKPAVKKVKQDWSASDMDVKYGRQIGSVYQRNKGGDPVYFNLAQNQNIEVIPSAIDNGEMAVPKRHDNDCNIYPSSTLQFIGFTDDGRGAVIKVYGKGMHYFGNPCPNGSLTVIPTRALPKNTFAQFNHTTQRKADYSESGFLWRGVTWPKQVYDNMTGN